MEQEMTIKEIESQFESEWILVEDPRQMRIWKC